MFINQIQWLPKYWYWQTVQKHLHAWKFPPQKYQNVRFPDFCPFERQTCPKYFWMPLNYLQHVWALYLGTIWRLRMRIEEKWRWPFTPIYGHRKPQKYQNVSDFLTSALGKRVSTYPSLPYSAITLKIDRLGQFRNFTHFRGETCAWKSQTRCYHP